MMRMNDRFLEDLKDRLDIRDIVGRYTTLKRSGKNWMGRSPFRRERTPSFSVSPDRNLWYDFGASEGGDMIRFIEKVENMSFHEAIEFLASIAGVDGPQNFGADPKNKEKKSDLYELHQAAADFFVKQLQQHAQANEYVTKERNFSAETTLAWQLGYGGDQSDGLTQHLLKQGFKHHQITESGVAFDRNFGDKTMKDRFSERIMIPIREPKNGKIIAFSGRTLSKAKKVAKYVNSPENPVYHKSATLFGLYEAKQAIRKRDSIILVEGNFDVVAAHASEITHTVATCGTSLTEEHLRIIRRFTKNITLAFDNDDAGKKATLKATEMVLQAKLNPFILAIDPSTKDIDEALTKDREAVINAAKEPLPALRFFLDRFAEKLLDKGIEGRKKFLDSYFYFLRLLERPIEIDFYIEEMAKKMNRPKSLIEAEFKKFAAKKVRYQKPKFVQETKPKKTTREESLVGFLCLFWEKIDEKISEKICELLTEDQPKNFLRRKIDNVALTADENTELSAWEMDQGHHYEDMIDQKTVNAHLKQFVGLLKKNRAKEKLRAEAEKVRAQLGG
jgi:DNA primase